MASSAVRPPIIRSNTPHSRSKRTAAKVSAKVSRGEWSPTSWRGYKAAQQPNYPNPIALEQAVEEIRRSPPLIFAGEARTLQVGL